MSIEEYLKKSQAEINSELKKFFPKKIDKQWMNKSLGNEEFEFDEVTYTRSIAEPIWDFLDRGGKRWRPALMLLCCEAVGGDRNKAMPFAVLPELAHTGSIIIDDVEDNSDVRRGKPSMHKLFGADIAINNGNLLYYLPMILLFNNTEKISPEQKIKIYDIYNEEMLRLSFGQGTDIYWHQGKKNNITENQYLQMCTFKTGSLARLSAKIGVILGKGTEEQTIKAGDFAAAIGVAFQIQDDILNIFPSNGWGKKLGDDIHEGKRSLIILYTLEKASEQDRKRLLEILDSKTENKEEIQEAIALIKKHDSASLAKLKAKELVETNWKKVSPLLKEGKAKNLLKEFADFLIERKI